MLPQTHAPIAGIGYGHAADAGGRAAIHARFRDELQTIRLLAHGALATDLLHEHDFYHPQRGFICLRPAIETRPRFLTERADVCQQSGRSLFESSAVRRRGDGGFAIYANRARR